MSQHRNLKYAVLCVVFVALLTAPAALHAMVTSSPAPMGRAARISIATPFAAICTAKDSHPDPGRAGAGFENDNCWAPKAPATFHSEIASRGEIVAAMTAVTNYNAALGAYQRCVATAVAFRKASAGQTSKRLDTALGAIESHRLTAGEEKKKKAAVRLAAEIQAFHAPGSDCN